MHYEINWSADHGECGEDLSECAAAKLARKFPSQPNGGRARHGGEKSQTDQPIAKKMAGNPTHQRDHRRLIDISPIEMLTAGQIVKFITKNSVTIRRQQVKEEFCGGEIENEGVASEKSRCRSCFHEILDGFLFSSATQRI
jgi:hypothetical protein